MKRTLMICLMALMAIATYAQEETPSVRLFAHRGGKAEFDENTLSAFNAAYKAGYRSFECDIRMTKDGNLVVMHDSSLEAFPKMEGNVETTLAKDLKNLRVGKSKILFLPELLEWIVKKGDIEYFEFELKTDEALYPTEILEPMCESLYHKIMATKPMGSTFIITSFDPRPLMFLRDKFSETNLAYITAEPVNNATITKVKELGLKRLNATMAGTSRDAVEKAHNAGIAVVLWPSDNVADIALGVSLGADAVCTDIPVAAKKALKNALPWVNIKY
ncbi:MAG: glycerophosphodiester phosphodiesterase [Bacteroidales bacterium]|nr:glycerophosphodiester phosphodiesterase [Bacteroidales bacterium]